MRKKLLLVAEWHKSKAECSQKNSGLQQELGRSWLLPDDGEEFSPSIRSIFTKTIAKNLPEQEDLELPVDGSEVMESTTASEVIKYEYHVLYSCSYQVPVLYFRASFLGLGRAKLAMFVIQFLRGSEYKT
ncbi:Ubiquitin-like-conjugating enzyme ATG10 [Lemmus lemmus]